VGRGDSDPGQAIDPVAQQSGPVGADGIAGTSTPVALDATRERPGASAEDDRAPLVAFKTWRIADGELRSRYLDVAWPGPVLEACCYADLPTAFRSSSPFEPTPHAAPHRRCGCGVHAELTPDLRAPKVDFRAVTGIVVLWGATFPAPSGQLRAAGARLCALGLYAHAGRRQRAAVVDVAERFEADVVDLRELQLAAERYGRLLPVGAVGVPG
jgi:hypothetical protein